ncbi:thymidylate kinase [Neisseria bacilliformis ATCC BAA-1200]|jgi:dTMP kinase|uniref:Thymidylate kinase n=1 Tax=Neisseria bacilliformis ATCC BAA-1200 TaxID=888742 RepID=F2BFJ8_9NEIS|nr:dTMP kinase [Neisseria bacilliformis]EGF08420.1 thymidylate kinase [Neisseria bacilliformis ATCC BAA-1200]QMT47093.1 dTMP kinase [Neisseria bacilliformis]
MHPRFITLDGIDGSGKSTHLAAMRDWFAARGLPVLFTREPGGTPLGEELRRLLLDPAAQVGLRTETLLMFAARQQHLDDVILPALEQGVHVVSDRFTDATFAYQGGGRGLPEADIAALEHWVQRGLRPDLTLILDVPAEVSFARVAKARDKDRFEQEQAAFFLRVRQAYLDRAAADPQRYRVIDSNRDKTEVRAAVETALAACFEAV